MNEYTESIIDIQITCIYLNKFYEIESIKYNRSLLQNENNIHKSELIQIIKQYMSSYALFSLSYYDPNKEIINEYKQIPNNIELEPSISIIADLHDIIICFISREAFNNTTKKIYLPKRTLHKTIKKGVKNNNIIKTNQ